MNLFRKPILTAALVTVGLCTAQSATAEALVDSGSTGADGALQFYAPPAADQGNERSMVYDHNRQVVVRYDGYTGLTWEFDGVKWLPKQTAHYPPLGTGGRDEPAMAYDRARNRVVLFGGRHNGNTSVYFGDTWLYDGTDWTRATPATSPSARYEAAMTYDVAHTEIILVGGHDGASNLNDTWTWNGSNWTKKTPTVNPPAEIEHSLAYDEERGVVVFMEYYTIYEWDGTDWEQKATPSHPYISHDSIVYDPVLKKILGFQSGRLFTWDGTNLQDVYTSSYNLHDDAVVYDVARGQVLAMDDPNTRLRKDGVWRLAPRNGPVAEFDMRDRADGIYHYTSIDLPAGVEVRFIPNAANTPVVWLATGNATIDGYLKLDGEGYNARGSGAIPTNQPLGGPGGGRGGLGGRRFDVSGSYAGFPGEGPGGGQPGLTVGQYGGDAGHTNRNTSTSGGRTADMHGAIYGNSLVRPLEGGSGGGGQGSRGVTADGYNGSAGGGAILIAANDTIHLDGKITVNGGNCSGGGCGSAGSIRLVATRIEGSGNLWADTYQDGRIRTEAFYRGEDQITRRIGGGTNTASLLPQDDASQNEYTPGNGIVITTVDGVAVANPPGGDLNAVDVTFDNAGAVTVGLSAPTIPQGTVIDLRVLTSSGIVEAQSTPLDAGGLATATVTVPAGFGRMQATATYIPPAP